MKEQLQPINTAEYCCFSPTFCPHCSNTVVNNRERQPWKRSDCLQSSSSPTQNPLTNFIKKRKEPPLTNRQGNVLFNSHHSYYILYEYLTLLSEQNELKLQKLTENKLKSYYLLFYGYSQLAYFSTINGRPSYVVEPKLQQQQERRLSILHS